MRTVKRCSRCKNLIRYPRRGKSRVAHYRGNIIRRILCPNCVERGWAFDEHGKVVKQIDLTFKSLLDEWKILNPQEGKKASE